MIIGLDFQQGTLRIILRGVVDRMQLLAKRWTAALHVHVPALVSPGISRHDRLLRVALS
jgi:hypothetical protein